MLFSHERIVATKAVQLYQASARRLGTPEVPDHVLREVVNSLHGTAIQWHATQQLRERLRSCLDPLFQGKVTSSAVDVADVEPVPALLNQLTTYGPNEWAAGADDEFGPREGGPYVKLADLRALLTSVSTIPAPTWQESIGAPP